MTPAYRQIAAPLPGIIQVETLPGFSRNSPYSRWMIPAIAGGSLAAILTLNVILFLVFVRPPGPVVVESIQPANIITTAPERKPSARFAPTPVLAPAAPESRTAEPESKAAESTLPPPKAVRRPAEEATDRTMDTAEIVSKYEPSVALIKGKRGSGTGFIARSGVVATNAHVIDGERIEDIEVRFPSAEETRQGPYPAKLLYQDHDRDLALLGVATDLPPVRIASTYKFRKGEDVTIIGNPGVGGAMILENAISRGVVSSMTKLNDHPFIQLGISINPGNSGGPVFDSKGRVIGVVTLKTTRQEGLAFAVPVDELESALGVAETMAENSPAEAQPSTPKPAPTKTAEPADAPAPRGPVPALAYAWKQGQSYAYSMELAIDTGSMRIVINGTSIYKIKAVDADGITLIHRGWIVTTKRGRDGKVLPGGMGNPESTGDVEFKIDPQGEVLSASGSSPLSLLGDFAMLLIEPFPDDPQRSWDDSKAITLNEIKQSPGGGNIPRLGRPGLESLPRGGSLRSRVSPRGRAGSRVGGGRIQAAPQPSVKVTAHEATEETNYSLGEVKGDIAPIRKKYLMATKETIGQEPRLKMTGEGTISFDLKEGIPRAMEYRLGVVENSENATFRIPISVNCKLLEGKDREQAIRPPVYNLSSMNQIDRGDLDQILANLKSPEINRHKEACRALFDSAPIENKRGEVSRALERVVANKDSGARYEIVKAMGVWGDEKIVRAMLGYLDDEKFGLRDELYEGLCRLSPTEKLAEALIPLLGKDPHRSPKAFKAIGPAAEGPLLRAVEEGTDLEVRLQACRLLREIATSQSVPGLEKIAQWKEAGEIGRAAENSLREIARRWPSDDEWVALMKQIRSPDGGKRRDAADRLTRVEPSGARRTEVARALESIVGDVDGGTQSLAFQALARWGDANSRPAIIARLEDRDLRPVREAIEALGKLGPDEASARAIASWIAKDRGAVIETLIAMGPVAERSAIDLLQEAKESKDGFFRGDVYRLVGKVGTRESLSKLRAAASEKDSQDAQRALKEVEERIVGTGGAGISKLLADLKSSDGGRRSQAVRTLAVLKPGQKGRSDAARALDAIWDIDDVFVKRSLREAIVVWGDDRSADFLADRLAQPEFKQWDEAIQVLVALRPDARTAELLIARHSQNWGFVNEVAKKMPPDVVERPLLAAFNVARESRWRTELCRALGSFGTPAMIPSLQTLARRANEDQLANEAEEALKAIATR